MASLKQQLSQTKSQLMAARQKPRDKEQLLLYPQSDCSNLTEGIFYRQTESAFQDVLHNPVVVTTLFIEQFSSRKMCFQHFAKQKKETLPMKTEALHTLTHTACIFSHASVSFGIGKFYNIEILKTLCRAACSLGDL